MRITVEFTQYSSDTEKLNDVLDALKEGFAIDVVDITQESIRVSRGIKYPPKVIGNKVKVVADGAIK